MSSVRFDFPKVDVPDVSIISLLFNKSHLTEAFLASLVENVSIPFQLILLDNASTDDTSSLLDRVEGALILRSSENLQFIRGNNLAAVAAKGKYILFLNNDTVVKKGMLERMLQNIEGNDSCFAVAAKILFPDGTLQEAGSIIWNNGDCYGYGRGQNPNLPEFNYRREVDYGSACCLLVRRDKFFEVGGFDNRYSPAYYEDSDLCMKLRLAGGRIIYEPRAEIVHHEYSSSSPEAALAKMRDRALLFQNKWESVLLKEHGNFDARSVLDARDRRNFSKLLYIDDRVPTPPAGCWYPRAYKVLEVLSEFFKVSVFPMQSNEPHQPWTEYLQDVGVECICDGRSLESFSQEREGYYDIIFVSRVHNFRDSIDIIRRFFPSARIVYDAEALFYARERLKRDLYHLSFDENFSQRMTEELGLFDFADRIILVSEEERKLLLKDRADFGFGLLENVYVFGHLIEAVLQSSGFGSRKDLLFVGAFENGSSPNCDAILYFIKEIFPTIQKELGCRLLVAGSAVPEILLQHASSNIIFLGFVEDLQPLYQAVRVFVVPHQFSGGIPWKLSEAMAFGLPAVCSSLTANQFGFVENNDSPVLTGKSSADFAEKVIALYEDKELWERTQLKSLNYIRETHSPEKLKNLLISIIDDKKAKRLFSL